MSEPIVQHPCDWVISDRRSTVCGAESMVFHISGVELHNGGYIYQRCAEHYSNYAHTSIVPAYYSYEATMLELVKSQL